MGVTLSDFSIPINVETKNRRQKRTHFSECQNHPKIRLGSEIWGGIHRWHPWGGFEQVQWPKIHGKTHICELVNGIFVGKSVRTKLNSFKRKIWSWERDQKYEWFDKPSEGKNLWRFNNLDLSMPTLNNNEGKGAPEGLCSKEGGLPCVECGR